MKTVMKKIGCLLLVAVLMVGYLPFQAMAAEVTKSYELTLTAGDSLAVDALAAPYAGSSTNYWVHRTAPTAEDYIRGSSFTAVEGGTYTLYVVETTSTPVCEHCGEAHETSACTRWLSCCNSLDTHDSSCTVPCTGAAGCTWTGAHKSTCTAPCTGAAGCTWTGTHKDTCPCPTKGCTLKNGHEGNCTIPCSKSSQCTKGNGHAGECDAPCTKTEGCNKNNGHEGDCFIPCTTTGCTLALGHTEPHTVPCTTANCALNLGHTGDCKCSCGLYFQKGSDHKTTCPYYELPDSHYTLKVWANLHVGGIKKETRELYTLTGLNKNTPIYQVIGANTGLLTGQIPSGYGWTGHVYYEKDTKNIIDMNSKLTVGDASQVYINLYSNQKLVVARVHTSKSYAVSRTVDINGFKVGQTVSSTDVLNHVKQFFNVSSMTMYTPDQWELVAQGKTANNISSYTVHDGDNIIDVYVQGSSKTSSGSKADSSNYKTGDMIFMPVFALAASGAALSVALYLAKKKVIK